VLIVFRKTINNLIRKIPPKREHYLNFVAPKGDPRFSDAPSYSEYLTLSTEERLNRVREAFTKFESILRDNEVSGYYAALSAVLASLHIECRGNSEVFAFRSYPFLCSYIFAPSARLYEQEVKTPLSEAPGRLKFFSTLTSIEYNIKANTLYSCANRLGRKKYLKYYFSPALTEVFKGLEYLSRLYFVSINNRESATRLKKFLKSFSSLQDKEINALWEFRCGLVHSGCLYNRNRNEIWRFGVNDGKNNNLIITQDTILTGIKGQHFTIHTRGLTRLFYEAKSFVHEDMLRNPEKYLTNDDFFLWIRRYLSMQYLPSQEEMRKILVSPSRQPNASELYFDSIPHFGIAKVKVSVPYILRLAFSRKKEDFLSRVRDFFSSL